MAKVGVLTIGQSPRTDATPSFQKIFGADVEIVERGGLDRLTEETLDAIKPEGSDTVYISRLRNGQSVEIGKSKLLPLLQDELTKLEQDVEVVIMLCTGDFPTLVTTKPIIYPDKILVHTVQAIMTGGSKLGLVVPLEKQRHSLAKKWEGVGLELVTAAASPYEESDIAGAAASLKEQGAELIVLDCMGYNETHKLEAKKGSGLPVILPRTLVARIAAEYVF